MHDCGHDGCDSPSSDHHTFTDGKRHCSCICDECGNPEAQTCYENFQGDLLCCECAGCFDQGAPEYVPVGSVTDLETGDTLPAILSPGAVACTRCDWAMSGGSETDRMSALSGHTCGAFWADLEEDMRHPEFRKHYERAMRKMNKERDATGILATGKRWARRGYRLLADLWNGR